MIHSLSNEPTEMPACRLVQQTSLLATASLPLISLLLLIQCFVHSQLFGRRYLNHTESIASGLAARPPSRRGPPGSLQGSLESSPRRRLGGFNRCRLPRHGARENLPQANGGLSGRYPVGGRQLNHGRCCDYGCFHSCL